jgi:hypothetical protein
MVGKTHRSNGIARFFAHDKGKAERTENTGTSFSSDLELSGVGAADSLAVETECGCFATANCIEKFARIEHKKILGLNMLSIAKFMLGSEEINSNAGFLMQSEEVQGMPLLVAGSEFILK